MVPQILSYFPGQKATFFLETLNPSTSARQDGYDLLDGYDGYPVISRIFLPDFTTASGYPTHMSRLDTGLYSFQYILPSTASAVGSFLIDGYYNQPTTGIVFAFLYQVVVTAPFGNYAAFSVGP
jgi:hypothetical protein